MTLVVVQPLSCTALIANEHLCIALRPLH